MIFSDPRIKAQKIVVYYLAQSYHSQLIPTHVHDCICFTLKIIQWWLLHALFSQVFWLTGLIYSKSTRRKIDFVTDPKKASNRGADKTKANEFVQYLQYLRSTHPPLLTPPFSPLSSDMPESLGEAVGVSRQDDTPTSVLDSKPTRGEITHSLITCHHH